MKEITRKSERGGRNGKKFEQFVNAFNAQVQSQNITEGGQAFTNDFSRGMHGRTEE